MNDAQEEEREELPLVKSCSGSILIQFQSHNSSTTKLQVRKGGLPPLKIHIHSSFRPTIQAQENCRLGKAVYPAQTWARFKIISSVQSPSYNPPRSIPHMARNGPI